MSSVCVCSGTHQVPYTSKVWLKDPYGFQIVLINPIPACWCNLTKAIGCGLWDKSLKLVRKQCCEGF